LIRGDYNLQQPGPHGGSFESQLVGRDVLSVRGLAGTLSKRSTFVARQCGQATGSLLKTSSSKRWWHFAQEYSYKGIGLLQPFISVSA